MRTRGGVVVICCLATASWATPVEDFIRGANVEINGAMAELHGTFINSSVTSTTPVCSTKAANSADISMVIAGVTVPFTGTAIDATHMRFAVDQTMSQCVNFNGTQVLIEKITGQITAQLNQSLDPIVGTCANDFAQNIQVVPAPSDSLAIDVKLGCSGSVLGDTVHVTNITLDGLSGLHEPVAPLSVRQIHFERTFICPAPAHDLILPGTLRLRDFAASPGASFTLTTSDPLNGVVAAPSPLFIPTRGIEAPIAAIIRAHYTGTFTVTATSGAASGTSADITVTNPYIGTFCRIPKTLIWRPTFGECTSCDWRGTLRRGWAAGVLARYGPNIYYSSAPSMFGTAGYSTLEGPMLGYIRSFDGTPVAYQLNTQFFDISDFGTAAGTAIDPSTSVHSPVKYEWGSVTPLATPIGQGEARFVNNDGVIGGWVIDGSNAQLASLWTSSGLQIVHPIGAAQSRVVALTDDGLASVQGIDSNGNGVAAVYDLYTSTLTPYATPIGWDGVEIIGTSRDGTIVGNLLYKGAKSPFVDGGGGVQLLSSINPTAIVIQRVISLGADGAILVAANDNGTPRTLLFDIR